VELGKGAQEALVSLDEREVPLLVGEVEPICEGGDPDKAVDLLFCVSG